MRYKFPLILAGLFVVLLASLSSSTAAGAASPEPFKVEVNQTQTLSVCGFPVIRHDEGTLIFQDAFDSNGNLLWENAIFSNWRITFTNPANGKSVSSVRAYNERFVQYEDGSFKAMSAGMVADLVIPGEGLVAANVGLISVIFNASGEPGSVLIAGEHDGQIARYVCPFLQ
jgi:hypothetical protein